MGFAKNIRMAMVDKGVKTGELSKITGINRASLSNSLSKDNMTYQRAEIVAEVLGCEIVLRDKETGKVY